MDDNGMFRPLPPHPPVAAGATRDRKRAWQPVLPVSSDAPPPPGNHPRLGAPSAIWTYRNSDGAVLGHVCRFEKPDGSKEFLPLTWCVHVQKGHRQWRWQGFDIPRPLYGLDRLAERPDAPVIICEGEKAADSAEILLPDFVSVTSPNGSNSARKADWSPLEGRDVTIWPDADAPGARYATTIAAALSGIATTVSVITPPEEVKPGWDAADTLAEAWIREKTLALVKTAQPHMPARPDYCREQDQQDGPPSNEKDGRKSTTTNANPHHGARTEQRHKRSQSDRLVQLIGDVEFWHSPDGRSYASVQFEDHTENWPVRSDKFRNWLTGRYFDGFERVPGSQATENALRVFEHKAHRGPEYPTSVRIGAHDDNLYLDLGDNTWRAIEITRHGWDIIPRPPVKFVRSRSTRPLPQPERGESIELLKPFLNCKTDADFCLSVAFLVAAFQPEGPFPVLMINGEQGTAKSTMARLLRELIDPRIAGLRSFPRDERELAIAADNAWCLAFDNISYIAQWLADALCRVSTGLGHVTRALHTDRDEIIFEASRPMILNGIPDLASRPDLGDRAISITLAPIPDDQRLTERELTAAFLDKQPEILGALLDAVSGALRDYEDVELASSPRMADFARWTTAAERSLGWPDGAVMEAFNQNQSGIVETALENNPVAVAIHKFMQDRQEWVGTATDLLTALEGIIDDGKKNSRSWKGTPNWLGVQIKRLAPVLRKSGINIEDAQATTPDRSRYKCITRIK